MEIKINAICRCCNKPLKAQCYSKDDLNVGYIGYNINTPVIEFSVEPCENCLAGLENFIQLSKEIDELRARVKPWNR